MSCFAMSSLRRQRIDTGRLAGQAWRDVPETSGTDTSKRTPFLILGRLSISHTKVEAPPQHGQREIFNVTRCTTTRLPERTQDGARNIEPRVFNVFTNESGEPSGGSIHCNRATRHRLTKRCHEWFLDFRKINTSHRYKYGMA